jgi:hypothetical protein
LETKRVVEAARHLSSEETAASQPRLYSQSEKVHLLHPGAIYVALREKL